MNKLFRFVCVTILVFSLLGCDTSHDNNENGIVFYYINNEIEYGRASGVITSTVVDTNVEPDDYESLLTLYFNGPTNYECVSPFPAGTTMEDFSTDGRKAQILLSPHMATIKDAELTVALACLTRTVIELTGVDTVQIQILRNTIYGENSVTLSLNSFDYSDDVMPGNS